MINEQKIYELALAYYHEIISIRNQIHINPELSFKEYKTADFIEEQLKKHGITSVERIIDTGVIAEIQGSNPGKTIALRADTDALPILENPNNPVCSQNEGVMHACGHDMHTASLLGTAFVINDIRENLCGKVVLIFQPGEEYMPSGAKMIMESGVLDKYNIDWIVGQHAEPTLEAGRVGFRSGVYMASTDELFITVHGQGGHGAFPHLLNDTVLAASEIVVALQQIISRKKNPVSPPSVLSFGRFIAEGATNIIPDKIEIAGTLRCMDEKWRQQAKKLITNIAQLVAKSYDTKCKVDIKHGYPSLYNEENHTEIAKNSAEQFLGKDRVVDLPLRMGGEDFAFYSQRYPTTFYRFGVKSIDKSVGGLHTPSFFGDEIALKTSAATMAWIAYSYLNYV